MTLITTANFPHKIFKYGTCNCTYHEIPLHFSEELFIPNQTTELFTKAIKITPGDIVFDIGSGIGPLTIWAALEPSKTVYSVEIVKEQCVLANINAKLNKVENKVCHFNGSFFDPIPKGIKADIVITDCSGMATKPARASGWFPNKIPTSGEDGTDNTITIINNAGRYLKNNGKLFFAVAVCFSDQNRILEQAHAKFKIVRKQIEREFPLPPKQKDAILASMPNTYRQQLKAKGSRLLWRAEIYEARNPNRL